MAPPDGDFKIATPEELNESLKKVYSEHKGVDRNVSATSNPMIFKMNMQETTEQRELRYALMKSCLDNPMPLEHFRGKGQGKMGKSSVSISSNIYGYDLRAPSLHLIPFLSPIRDMLPRVQHAEPGNAANWKTISASGLTMQGFNASPYLNEGQRAPQFQLQAVTNTAPYATIGLDGSDTYEAQSSGRGFEDPLSTARFIGLEQLMVMEENVLLGGNTSLPIGTANTPSGTGGTDIYVGVVGLTYEGYQNYTVTNGITGSKTIVTPDSKTMTVNGGAGQASAISAELNKTDAVLVAQKKGEVAWAWYIGTANSASALHLQLITTVPTLTPAQAGATLVTTTQTFDDAPQADYSVNNGTAGGGQNQVTAFDGFLVQSMEAAGSVTGGFAGTNAYYKQFAGAKLTPTGTGGIVEIDDMIEYQWNTFRSSIEMLFVNGQELRNITKGVLTGASAPLVRYDVDGSDDSNYDLVASGTVSFYFNPYLPGGGRRIPIIVHPYLPPGTIFGYGKSIPPYFKKSNMGVSAEVICKRDYYSIDWAPTTREYQFGTYSEEVLALYAPFQTAVLTSIGNGLNAVS